MAEHEFVRSLTRNILLLTLLIFPASSFVQAQTRWDHLQIVGHVFDADGKPIPGATIHFRGEGDVINDQGKVLNPTTLTGETTTAADGSYAFTGMPEGHYFIRVAAPGYFGVLHNCQAFPAGFTHSMPAGFRQRLRALGVTDATIAESGELESPDFHLRWNAIHLTAMKVDDVAAAMGTHREEFDPKNGSLSPDGSLFALAIPQPGAHAQGTDIFLYDLATQETRQVSWPALDQPDAHFGRFLAWSGNTLYIVTHPDWNQKLFASATFEEPSAVALHSLPPEVQSKLTVFEKDTVDSDSNALFRVDSVSSCEGPCVGVTIVATDKKTHRHFDVYNGSQAGFLLDHGSSTLFYPILKYDPAHIAMQNFISAFDLPSRRRSITVLPSKQEDFSLYLLAERHLPSGYLVAYSVRGNCDPAIADPDPNGDNEAKGWSVCFATIQPPAAPRTRSTPR